MSIRELWALRQKVNVSEIPDATDAAQDVYVALMAPKSWDGEYFAVLLESLGRLAKEGADVTRTEEDDAIADRINAAIPHLAQGIRELMKAQA